MTTALLNSFYVEQVRNVTVVCFAVSHLDSSNFDAVSDELLELLSMITTSPPVCVVVEMSYVRRIDELGVAMLVAFQDSVKDAGGRMILCRLAPSVQNELYEMGRIGEFSIRLTRSEAVWEF